MEMKLIDGYENYLITECGLIYSNHKKSYLNMYPHKDVGYFTVQLWKNNNPETFYVHRLVATAFLDNPLNLPEVNHKDGNKLNNHFSNLEWVTSSQNSHHAVNTGLRIYTNRLSKQEFIDCLHSVIGGESYAELSKRVPYKVPFLSTKLRKLATELGVEGQLNVALKLQRAERNRKVLSIINASKVQRLEQ